MAALKSAHPNTSFPKRLPDNGLPDFGVYPVGEADAPSYNVRTQNIERQSPNMSGGTWSIAGLLCRKLKTK